MSPGDHSVQRWRDPEHGALGSRRESDENDAHRERGGADTDEDKTRCPLGRRGVDQRIAVTEGGGRGRVGGRGGGVPSERDPGDDHHHSRDPDGDAGLA